MWRKGLIASVLALVFSISCFAVPEVPAPSYLLMDAATGTVLCSQNPDERLAPASVTKVMTLLLVLEAIDRGSLSWDGTVTASAHAAGKGGSQVYLEEGEQMSVREMVKCVVVASANDCAAALAEAVAGSEDAFVEEMNRRAGELGMENTHFANCTGLDDEAGADVHYTTARDIALMSRELLTHPEIREFTTIWMDTIRDGSFGLTNTNKLVRFYPDATGLKTGYTRSAGYCMSATAQRDGMELIAAVMHCDSSTDRFQSAKALLEYGFSAFSLIDPLEGTALPPVTVTLGEADAVQPKPLRAEPMLLEKVQAAGLSRQVELADAVEAPVEAGQALGTLRLMSGDAVIAEIPLVAETGVGRLTWAQLLRRLIGAPWQRAG